MLDISDNWYICYDHGWGECGVHEHHISSEQVLEWLAVYAPNWVEKWRESGSSWFETWNHLHIVHASMFDDERWRGSSDW